MKSRFFVPFFLFSALACAPPGQPAPAVSRGGSPAALDVREYTLDNGLRLLVLPRPGAPIASFVVQYRIGGVNEKPGNTGIAHFLEHLLFKGTTSVGTRDFGSERSYLRQMDTLFDSILVLESRPTPDREAISALEDQIRALEREAAQFVISNELDQILAENGARNLNATTSSESTNYYVELPSNRVELWFALEADRMENPVFREFFTERDVVAEERRTRLENSPAGILQAAHMAAAFQSHPYGRPVVGSMEDIQRLTRREVESYFRSYYGPNNAVVAIAGDVDPEEILSWAEEYFGPIPRAEEPPPVQVVEPEQVKERRVLVRYDAEPALRIGWKVPSAQSRDAPALYMLSSILTGGRSSRLYRRLVTEERVAGGVVSSIEPGQLYPGLFSVQASPLHPHTTVELEAAIYEELEALVRHPPAERELQRVKNQLEASEVRRLRFNFGLAAQVAGSESLYGDWRKTFEFSDELLQVSPEDIQRVVAEYFRAENRTVATLARSDDEGGRHP